MSDLISSGSLVIFIIVTIIYYLIGKNKLGIENIQTEEELVNFHYSNLSRLAIYFLVVVISQFILNAIYLGNKCNNSTGTIGTAAFFTFIPWVLIFGVLLGVLIVFPGFKSAFSDVIGYFVVAGKANDIFSSILIDTELKESMDNDNLTTSDKSTLSKSAEAIMKICGNKSVLINQINPDNFLNFWNMLKPLMKPELLNTDELLNKQTELLDLVVKRDNIGEAIWYVYSAILISSIVYYNLATQGCSPDVATIKANREQYIKEQETISQQNATNKETIYSVDGAVQE